MAAFALTACGSDDSLPGNAVARVGDETIRKSELDKWMRIAVLSFASQGQPPTAPAPKVTVPDPPDFKQCIADKRKSLPKSGQGLPAAAQLKKQCSDEFKSLREEMTSFLISNQWFTGEAADLDVKVSDKELNTQITQARSSLPKGTDFEKFLAKSGQTPADFRLRVRISLLQNAIREKVSKDTAKVTPAAIKTYYEKNRKQFAQPERRDLRVVLTGAKAADKAKAEAAKSALQAGQSWKSVAKRYSTDAATKDKGGALPNVTKGPQDPALDKAVFAAKRGTLVGPIKTQLGYYVFQVQRILPPKQQTLKEATPTIRQVLTAENQNKVGKAYDDKFKKKWKGRTKCREDFEVPLCDGVPEPKQTTPQGAPPAQGQQAPPQQAPAG